MAPPGRNVLPLHTRYSEGQPDPRRIVVILTIAVIDLVDTWNQKKSMDEFYNKFLQEGGTAFHFLCCACCAFCLFLLAVCHVFTTCCLCCDPRVTDDGCCCCSLQWTEVICAGAVWLGHFPSACCKLYFSKQSRSLYDLAVTLGRMFLLAVRGNKDCGWRMQREDSDWHALQWVGLAANLIMPVYAYLRS